MIEVDNINFAKMNGLIPAVIIDDNGGAVLMVGFMNREALEKTLELGKVTFFSRSKNRLWTKGETSGNYLFVKEISSDCDNDTLLIKADPAGEVCHLGNYSCFKEVRKNDISFIADLFSLIKERKIHSPEGSYTAELFKKGIDRIAQKVGEEAVETVIASKNNSRSDFIYETSDLIYHLLVLLAEKDVELSDIIDELKSRHNVGK